MTNWIWSRRQVLGGLGAGAGVLTLGSCSQDAQGVRFDHGVASGDPLQDRVIIWTRVTPVQPAPERLAVRWQVAADRAFETIVSQGQAETSAVLDFTVKVDADGLEPNKTYFYRFQAAGVRSPVGRTRTLPAGDVDEVSLAVVSCSNYPQGYFNVYRDIARRNDIDLVLHLGDYLYEYPDGVYANEQALKLGRHVRPEGELLALEDYRVRHALYKSDPDLQAAHGAHPFIVVWDDHELANDAWTGGAENHNEGEGAWHDRRDAAIRAFREWIPIRDIEADSTGRIFRSFEVGNLASLIMLDTRVIGRDEQISYQDDMIYRTVPFDFSDPEAPVAITDSQDAAGLPSEAIRELPVPFDMTGSEPRPILDYNRIAALDPENLPEGVMYLPDAERFRDEVLLDPSRSMLGAEQEAWLRNRLADSKARGVPWQVLGQQVLMGKLVPPDVSAEIDPDRPSVLSRRQQALFGVLARLGLPLNLDAWDGYWAARERLFEASQENANNLLVLAGDTHNAWAFNLMDSNGSENIGVELGTASVSSPGLERYVPVDPAITAESFVAKNPELEYLNSKDRGYLTVTLNNDAARADFHFVSNVLERQFETRVEASFEITAGRRRLARIA